MSYVSFIAQIIKRAQGEEYVLFQRLFWGLNASGLNLESKEARNHVEEMWKREIKMQENKERVG